MFIVMNNKGRYLCVSEVSSHAPTTTYEYTWEGIEKATTLSHIEFNKYNNNLKTQSEIYLKDHFRLDVVIKVTRDITIIGVIE